MKILLVEDDRSLIDLLTKTISAHNFVVDAVQDGEAGWNYGSTFEYDLIVLDILLPKLDGISLCQRFRAEGFTTPILLLTSEETSTAKVRGLDAGADDYVVKPFDLKELLARIRALLRRSYNNPLPLLSWGDLLLNPSTCEVTYNDRPLELTTKEYELLELFLRNTQHVLSSDEILDRLWSSEEFPAEATVRSHIRRLRHKLTKANAPVDFISTVRGRGYYLKETSSREDSLSAAASDGGFFQAQNNSFETNYLCNSQSEPHLQYITFLNETWKNSKKQSLEDLRSLNLTLANLYDGNLDIQCQNEARHLSHKLAGTLGIFGLNAGMQLARELERVIKNDELLQPQHLPLIEKLLTNLHREIEGTNTIEIANLPGNCISPTEVVNCSPKLLIIDLERDLASSLAEIASSRDIDVTITSDFSEAKTWLASQSIKGFPAKNSSGILLRMASSHTEQYLLLLQWLEEMTQKYSTLPILVMGDRFNLKERLEVIKKGGKLFLDRSTTPEQAIDSMLGLLNNFDKRIKVAIVDDDLDWLKVIPKLLEPWDFKVTTLADPQQFWTVMQTLQPDVLVLDINMPAIDGLELCQVLRSDPQWQKLPVLFVSALSDSSTQNQAFRVGADDYLCKPVIGLDLANRILNRLQRVKACKLSGI
jgi:DNA-binding response OmpR family regulator